MIVLITGAKGFVGRNSCTQLKIIRDGKARNHGVTVTEIMDMTSPPTSWPVQCDQLDDREIRSVPPLLRPPAFSQACGGQRFQTRPRVIQHETLGFHDDNCLQMNAFSVVSDSGPLPEESSFLTSVGHPFLAVCIQTSAERLEPLIKLDSSWPASTRRACCRQSIQRWK